MYAERLGLWSTAENPSATPSALSSGIRSIFHSFKHFQGALQQRGLGSLEMLALEMKQMGTFVARTLSWDGAEFETVEVPLNPSQTRVYDEAVQWWTKLKIEIEEVLDLLSKMGSPPNKIIWRAFWSAHQRFFREMAVCGKVPFIAADAKRVLQGGCSVIVGLQSTGEAGTQSALDELKASLMHKGASNNPDTIDMEKVILPELLSTAGATMINFVRNHFPVAPLPPEPPKGPTPPANGFSTVEARMGYMQLQAEAERIKSLPPPSPLSDLLQRRQKILEKVAEMALPPNPLDDLIERLGGIDEVRLKK